MAIARRLSPGGRGARERILKAADVLFQTQGVAETEVADLLAAAEVSRRSFYQYFAGKQAVLASYLQQLEQDPARTPLGTILREGVSARERLAELFDGKRRPPHGCPFSNAVSLSHDPKHEPHAIATSFKAAFAHELTRLARDAGARHPEQLGKRLSIIYNGAILESAIFGSPEPLDTARGLALELFDAASAPEHGRD